MTVEIEDTQPIIQYGVCPSCGAETTFELLGIQRWPEAVAQKLNIPQEETIWQCGNCDTTLSESSLKRVFTAKTS